MKLTKNKLKQLIKEELQAALKEQLKGIEGIPPHRGSAKGPPPPEYHSPVKETNRLLRETNELLWQLVKLANRSWN